ncbi:hypothetical protein HQ571_00060 [Candidatus Kuenenbacteria bacterium]|nr:hypothetical protein [Candidatus Kuenenbacteria bacterium]
MVDEKEKEIKDMTDKELLEFAEEQLQQSLNAGTIIAQRSIAACAILRERAALEKRTPRTLNS